MCMHGKFMLTQNVTVTGHYLSIFVSSAEGFLVWAFHHGGPLSTVGLASALEWFNVIWVAIADPGIVLYCLSYIEALSLGFISLSSESLSDMYLL